VKRRAVATIIVGLLVATAACQTRDARRHETIVLWPEGAPGAVGSGPEDIPTLTLYRPSADTATGAAIVVCPGGGYARLASHESGPVGEWLAERGVLGAVLRYRLGPRYRHPAPLSDAARAVRTLRVRAPELGIDADKVGVWGFSAGGHLAATLATHFDAGDPASSDPVERLPSRPDLVVLAYPVITMSSELTHLGSREMLLGSDPSAALVRSLSNETQVVADTPPTFIFHGLDDRVVPVQNSRMFAHALGAAGVEHELYLAEHARHGIGLALSDPELRPWTEVLERWLRRRGFAIDMLESRSGSGRPAVRTRTRVVAARRPVAGGPLRTSAKGALVHAAPLWSAAAGR
jgi:acetyl esterase/lipase